MDKEMGEEETEASLHEAAECWTREIFTTPLSCQQGELGKSLCRTQTWALGEQSGLGL